MKFWTDFLWSATDRVFDTPIDPPRLRPGGSKLVGTWWDPKMTFSDPQNPKKGPKMMFFTFLSIIFWEGQKCPKMPKNAQKWPKTRLCKKRRSGIRFSQKPQKTPIGCRPQKSPFFGFSKGRPGPPKIDFFDLFWGFLGPNMLKTRTINFESKIY